MGNICLKLKPCKGEQSYSCQVLLVTWGLHVRTSLLHCLMGSTMMGKDGYLLQQLKIN